MMMYLNKYAYDMVFPCTKLRFKSLSLVRSLSLSGWLAYANIWILPR